MTALEFGTAEGAEQALNRLLELQKQRLITIQDAAIVSWPEGKKKPRTRQAHSMAAAGTLGGAFWGMLLGLIFFMPFLGMAMGAAMGALTGKMRDYGIDDTFIAQIKDNVTEGTSALFLLTSNEVQDKVMEDMKTWPRFKFISTNLTREQEERLRTEFGEP